MFTASSLFLEELTTNSSKLLSVSLPQIPFHKLKYYLLWMDSFIHRQKKVSAEGANIASLSLQVGQWVCKHMKLFTPHYRLNVSQ